MYVKLDYSIHALLGGIRKHKKPEAVGDTLVEARK